MHAGFADGNAGAEGSGDGSPSTEAPVDVPRVDENAGEILVPLFLVMMVRSRQHTPFIIGINLINICMYIHLCLARFSPPNSQVTACTAGDAGAVAVAGVSGDAGESL